jgi:acetolactate synthase-1/2/3 large subunit
MNLGELETATTYNLPVKVLLLNNLGDGMVRQWQKLFFEGRLSGTDKSLHKKDFVKAAQADGYTFARRISNPAEVIDTLKAFIAHKGPAFLEVMIDPNACVWPMVGPGKGYKEMTVGDFIKPRTIQAPVKVEPVKADLF